MGKGAAGRSGLKRDRSTWWFNVGVKNGGSMWVWRMVVQCGCEEWWFNVGVENGGSMWV